ncbi:MAG TPA: cytochrome P450 [Ktedonobacteraceae bacterium]|nr:cytochrome P450 [Ktedonobacteraceae bacterium]
MIPPPHNPIVAVTHPDPYAYYAALVASRPIYRDEPSGLWVAASAAAVTAILTSELCRVRPPKEQVPGVLLGSSAADIFRHLVRMNDGHRHSSMKVAVSSTLRGIGTEQIAEQSTAWARLLIDEMELEAGRLTDFTFHLPIYVIASLLGISREMLPQTALWMSDFVRCLAPTSTPEQIEQGKGAANHLLDLLHTMLDTPEAEPTARLLSMLAHGARSDGLVDKDAIVANGIGLLSQTYEATAGLIGNTLLALVRHEEIREQVLADPDRLDLVIQEVLRYDPPIQNTRRYLSGNGVVAGEEMKGGDMVLVVLAAANRDPAVNSEPERFDIFRKDRRLFTFGVGAHLCPGENMAAIIARAGVEQLLSSGIDVLRLIETVRYRPSGNARIPVFAGGEEK